MHDRDRIGVISGIIIITTTQQDILRIHACMCVFVFVVLESKKIGAGADACNLAYGNQLESKRAYGIARLRHLVGVEKAANSTAAKWKPLDLDLNPRGGRAVCTNRFSSSSPKIQAAVIHSLLLINRHPAAAAPRTKTNKRINYSTIARSHSAFGQRLRSKQPSCAHLLNSDLALAAATANYI